MENKETWYDMWHTHTDWKGQGNESWEKRKKFLDIIFKRLWKEYAKECKEMGKPFQIWIVIDLQDSGQDAIYMHTKNPNGDNFPIKLVFDKVLAHAIDTELVKYLERKKSFRKWYMEDKIIVAKENFGEKLF